MHSPKGDDPGLDDPRKPFFMLMTTQPRFLASDISASEKVPTFEFAPPSYHVINPAI